MPNDPVPAAVTGLSAARIPADQIQLRAMSVRELCAIIESLDTLDRVGTALLNAPRMTKRGVDSLNAAGELLDQHIGELMRLKDTALACLMEVSPAEGDADHRASTIVSQMSGLGAEEDVISRTAEELVAGEVGRAIRADAARQMAPGIAFDAEAFIAAQRAVGNLILLGADGGTPLIAAPVPGGIAVLSPDLEAEFDRQRQADPAYIAKIVDALRREAMH